MQHEEMEDFNLSYYEYEENLISLENHVSYGSVTCAVFYILIICISLPGNAFLLWVLKQEGLRSSSDWLLLHLAASDLLFTLMLIPWSIDHVHSWIFGELGCKLFNWGIFLGLYSYMTFLAVISVHRYVVIVHPVYATSVRNRFGLNTHVVSSVAWLISLGFSVPEFFISKTVEGLDMVFCIQSDDSEFPVKFGYFSQIVLFFLLPFLAIAFCYARMGCAIRRSHMASRNRHNATGIIFCVAVGFFICWAPYNVFLFLLFLSSLDVAALQEISWENLEMAYMICHILAYSHSCLNPLIHIIGGKKFRRYLSWSSQRYRRYTFSSQSSFSGQTHL